MGVFPPVIFPPTVVGSTSTVALSVSSASQPVAVMVARTLYWVVVVGLWVKLMSPGPAVGPSTTLSLLSNLSSYSTPASPPVTVIVAASPSQMASSLTGRSVAGMGSMVRSMLSVRPGQPPWGSASRYR